MTLQLTKTKTKYIKYPTCAIFLKSRGLTDIKYDTHRPHPDRIHTASRLHLGTLRPYAPFAQFIPFSIFAIFISFVFYAPFVPVSPRHQDCILVPFVPFVPFVLSVPFVPLVPIAPYVPYVPFVPFIPSSPTSPSPSSSPSQHLPHVSSFIFYAPFVPFKSFRMIGNSWVSRIPRNSITRSDMPSALVNCDLSACFLQQKLGNEWNHVFVPFSTCSWFCSLAAIFAVFACAQIVEASIV